MKYNINDILEELKGLSIETPIKKDNPNDKILDKYEGLIDFKLPDDYRLFLKEASNVFVGLLSPFTIEELPKILTKSELIGIPKNYFPICEDNGDYYCLLKDGSIRFWSHDGFTSESWPDIATWIKKVWIDEE